MAEEKIDNSTFLESLDRANWFNLDVESDANRSELVPLDTIPSPSSLDESFTDPFGLNHLNYVSTYEEYDSSSESEESEQDDELMEENNQFEEDSDKLLLSKVRDFLTLNVKMTELFNLVKSKIIDKYEELGEDTLPFEMPPLRTCDVFKDCWYKFNPPYFKDQYNFHCTPNIDVRNKEKYGIISYSVFMQMTNNFWNPSNRKTLCHCVKEELIEKEIFRLQSIKNHLIRSLKDVDKIQIGNIDKEMEEVRRKSLVDLMEGKDDWEFDWDKISTTGLKCACSSEDCALYWHVYLKPSVNKARWSKKEDDRLVELTVKYKHQNWEKIAKELGTNRSPFQTFVHFLVRFQDQPLPYELPCYWSPSQERALPNTINACTFRKGVKWLKASRCLNRPLVQVCKKYWDGISPSPELVKGRFTKEEDMLIVSGIQEFGFDSIILQSLLKHRTTSQIMSRYRRLVPDTVIEGPWEVHEDELLLKLVEKYGCGQWSKIAKQFVTRNRTQIRQRYSVLRKQMEQKDKLNVTELRRRQNRKIVNKNKSCDVMVEKVLKKIDAHKLNVPDENSSIKFQQINDVKAYLFRRQQCNKVYWTEQNLLESQIIELFMDKSHICKLQRKTDVASDPKVAEKISGYLVYLNADITETYTKSDIEEKDSIDEETKSVLCMLMQEGVFDFKLIRENIIKSIKTEEDSNRTEVVGAIPSTSGEFYNTRKRCHDDEVFNIDCPPVKREDCLVDLKEHWLSSEIVKEERCSQVIGGRLDEFSVGVFNFLKIENQTDSFNFLKIENETESMDSLLKSVVPVAQSVQIDNSCLNSSNLYPLPINVTTLILSRTIYLSTLKIEEQLFNERLIKKELNESNLQEYSGSDVKYKRKFREKEYASKCAFELPATKLLMQRCFNLLYWTNFVIENSDIKISPKRSRRPRYKVHRYKAMARVRLGKRSVRETYTEGLCEGPPRAKRAQKETKIVDELQDSYLEDDTSSSE